ncbi:MAG: heptaprenylglyceryl phosphate synthase [bacterium]|nr:heptaprenylglyceryl phosphate synthase [bacterium]
METWRQRLGNWRHLTKLDPDRLLDDRRLEAVLGSGTDALVLGGTQGITSARVQSLLRRVAGQGLPVAIEVSSFSALVPGADLYLVPVVLNAGDPFWIVGAHQQAVRAVGEWTRELWDLVVAEGYVILNPASAVAQLTAATAGLSAEEVVAYARCAEELLGLPVLYLEYSGCYGDPRVVRAVGAILGRARLFYGGGIDSPARAREMAALADTVVVGNLVYEGDPRLLAQVVAAVRSTPARTPP